MDITQITQSGFNWNLRVPKAYQDEHLIFEVVACDCYHLAELKDRINPKVILDIGGHIGTFGVLAKSFWPDAELVVVEPVIENLVLYHRNMHSNQMENVRFIRAALSYNPRCTHLVHSPNTTGGYLMRTPEMARQYIHHKYRNYDEVVDDNVPLVTMEDLTEDYDQVDLIKWDCEGAEIEAFRRMADRTAAKCRYMVGEYHIWGDNAEWSRASVTDCILYWRTVRRKFPHLYFNYQEKLLGNFQAWPHDDMAEQTGTDLG